MKVSILIPAYNEIRTIGAVLDKLSALPLDFEAVIVDDGSKDGTADWVEQARKENKYPFVSGVYRHAVNQGKGAAVRTAIEKAAGDVLVIQDADTEYDPVYIPRLVKLIEEGKADVAYGSRLLSNEAETYNIFYLWGNEFLTWVTNVIAGGKFTDSYTCYKAFRREILQSFGLTSRGFEIEAELSVKVAMGGYKFAEIPIAYKSRSREEGKKINGKDAVKGLLTIVKTWNLERGRHK